MDISFVIPVLNEEQNVVILVKEIEEVLSQIKKKYEIIFVDDGSTDSTPKILDSLKKDNKNIKVITSQRNFGKSAAFSAAFKEVKGDIVFTLDGDLQDNPYEIPKFLEAIEQGYDMISGWKFKRNDPITKTIPSKFFNWLTARLTGVKVHDSNCGFKAYKKGVIKNVKIYGELHRYIPALAANAGFKVGEIKVIHRPRIHGKTKYGIERLLKGSLDLITIIFITKYGRRPLHLFGTLGIISLLLGFLGGLYLTIGWFQGIGIGNRPLLLLSVLLMLLGVQLFGIGLIAEMINLNKDREDYIIKEKK